MKLSVIIPVYNEKGTIKEVISKVKALKIEKEIIVVDDCSSDGTQELLKEEEGIKVLYHPQNMGKGAAVRSGIRHISGDLVIIQDADLEYEPEDYPQLIKPILEGKAKVVYGSRFKKKGEFFSALYYWANKFLTLVTNILYNSMLSDMETCYKVFKVEVIRDIRIESNRFNFEPEITAKVLKRGYKIFEVPISYRGRGRKMSKKIDFKDGLEALYCLVKYRIVG